MCLVDWGPLLLILILFFFKLIESFIAASCPNTTKGRCPSAKSAGSFQHSSPGCQQLEPLLDRGCFEVGRGDQVDGY